MDKSPTTDYPYLRAYRAISGTDACYTASQLAQARRTGAPADAVFEVDGSWVTLAALTDQTRADVEWAAAQLRGGAK